MASTRSAPPGFTTSRPGGRRRGQPGGGLGGRCRHRLHGDPVAVLPAATEEPARAGVDRDPGPVDDQQAVGSRLRAGPPYDGGHGAGEARGRSAGRRPGARVGPRIGRDYSLATVARSAVDSGVSTRVGEEWLRRYRDQVGRRRGEVATPALLLDLGAARRNLERMARLAGELGVALRPHVKAHKSAELARLQIEAGAIGVTCATVWEAVVM